MEQIERAIALSGVPGESLYFSSRKRNNLGGDNWPEVADESWGCAVVAADVYGRRYTPIQQGVGG
jgi:hypothetical protein